MSDKLSDARRFWKLAATPAGIHSHDARRAGVSGNPSQRAKDCADHTPMWKIRAPRNGRAGVRYFADGYQPSDAEPVKPNRSIAPVSTGGITYRSYGPASDGKWHFNLTREQVDAMIENEAQSLGLAA